MKIVITPEPVMLLTQIGPVTKIDKRNMAMSKKFDDDVMSANLEQSTQWTMGRPKF